MNIETIARKLWCLLPTPGIKSPVFILGCGRSGTTVFGNLLSHHPAITYLNEPRNLWYSAFPQADIWTDQAEIRQGRMVLTEADAKASSSKLLSRQFRFETLKTGRPVLVEKLPINNFRLKLLTTIFPDARFIHIHRNGIEVAKSIEHLCLKGDWFAANDYKWNQLVEFAQQSAATSELPNLCDNYFLQGLLEWRLSTETAVSFLSSIPQNRFIELNYSQLLDNPTETLTKVTRFLGLADSPETCRNGEKRLTRRSTPLANHELSAVEKVLGGNLLPMAMQDSDRLTPTRRSPP